MKRISLKAFVAGGILALLALGFSLTNTYAAAPAAQTSSDDGLVTAQAPSSLFLTVYGNRFAQVEQTRRVHLDAGANRILLDGIAAHYRADSLRIIDAKLAAANALNPKLAPQQLGKPGKALTYLSATYQPANLTAEKLLAASVGKRVSIANGDQKVEGVLLSVNGSTAIVKTDDGKTSVIPASSATVGDLPKGLSNTAALVVEVWADVEGDYDVDFIYDTDGISWTAKHSLVYDDEKSVVESWETGVAIENNSGATFRNAVVSLLPGKVVNESAESGRMYAPARLSSAPAGFGGAQDAAVGSVGDQTTYTLPEKTSLVDGQTRQVPLFVAHNVPVKREYFIPASSPGYWSRGKQEMSIRLEVDNCENKQLGKPLPAGSVRVYQHSGKTGKGWNAPNPVQLVGSTQIGAKAVDEVFQMVIGTAQDVKWERTLVDRKETTAPGAQQPATQPVPAPQPLPNRLPAVRPLPPQQVEEVWEARTYKITVFNFKRDRDIEVTVEMNYPADQIIGNPWTLKEDINQANTKVTAPKSGQNDVRYTIKERVR